MTRAHSILIVEDFDPIRTRLAERFKEEGFNIFEAHDGESAVNTALDAVPDIILLDIMLPKINGLDVLASLKKYDKTKSIPVIMLTNLTGSEEVAQALEQGVHDYLIKKDWSLDDVVRQVRYKLGA